MHETLLFFVGIIVGVMNAIAGGGMLIGFPVLLATGMPALLANATTSIIVIPGNIAALAGYRKYVQQIPRRYTLLTIPLVSGAALGTVFLRHTSVASYQKLVPMLVLIAVLLFVFQPFLHNHARTHIHGPKKYRDEWSPLLLLALAFFPIAIYGGFFGTGVGFIMLAFLGFTSLNEVHRMTALKNIIMSCIAITNFACLANSHLINYHYGIPMAIGNAAGGYLGARWAQRVSSHAIRIVVIVIGLSAAAYLAFCTY